MNRPPHKSIDAELDDILFGRMIDTDIDFSVEQKHQDDDLQ